MSRYDIKVVKGDPGAKLFPTAATLKQGEPVLISGGAAVAVTATKPVIGTDRFLGVCAADSGQEEAGYVRVYMDEPGTTIYEGAATTSGNVAENLVDNAVTFDVASGVFTVDENDATASAGLIIRDVDTDKGTVQFSIDPDASHVSA